MDNPTRDQLLQAAVIAKQNGQMEAFESFVGDIQTMDNAFEPSSRDRREIGNDLVDNIMDTGSDLISGLGGLGKEVYSGDIPPHKGIGFAITEQLIPAAGEAVMDVIGAGLEAGSLVVPDMVERKVVNGLSSTVSTMSEIPLVKSALSSVAEGAEFYSKWSEKPENQEAARLTNSLATVLFIRAAKVEAPGNLGTRIRDSGLASEKKMRTKGAIESITPEEIPLRQRSLEGLNQTTTFNPLPYELEIVDELIKIKGWKPNDPYVTQWQKIQQTVDSKREALDASLRESTAVIDLDEINKQLKAAAKEAIKTQSTGVTRTVPLFVREAQRLLKKTKGRPDLVMQARRDLDKFFDEHSPKVFDADYLNAKAIAGRIVRDVVNDSVIEAVPSALVKQILTQQSRLLTAMDRIEPKALKASATAVGRRLDAIQDQSGIKPVGSTLLATGATVSSAGAFMSGHTVVSGLIAAGASIYTLAKTAAHPSVRKFLGELLIKTGKPKAKLSAAQKQLLGADRAVIVSLMQEYDRALAAKEKEPKEK